ncbi:MAG: oligosaccharide flippase family protein [Colwellia sp.]|nr:oligosaccharide flippase family protein [Colwellia sp.]
MIAINRRTLATNSLLLMIVKLSSAALAFIFHLLMARQLPVAEYGLFSLALTCLMFSVVFAKQGIEPAIVRFFAIDSDNKCKISNLYLYIVLYTFVNSLVVALVIVSLKGFISFSLLNTAELKSLLPVVAGLTAIQTWLSVNNSVLRGLKKPLQSMFFTGFCIHAFGILLLLINPPVTGLQALNLFFYAVIIATCLSFFVVSKQVDITWRNIKNIDSSGINKLYSTSRVLFVSSLAALLSQQFAVLLLARYASLADIALYSIALKVSLLMSYPLIVLNTITAPLYAKMYEQRQFTEFKQLAWLTTKGLILIATPLCLFVMFFSIEIVSFFGEKYLSSATILSILILGQWVNLSTGTVISMLVMTGHEKTHRRNSVASSLFTIVLMYWLIPLHGILAAAWISSASMAMFNLISLYYVYHFIYRKG